VDAHPICFFCSVPFGSFLLHSSSVIDPSFWSLPFDFRTSFQYLHFLHLLFQ
jgi:hypothetical protein